MSKISLSSVSLTDLTFPLLTHPSDTRPFEEDTLVSPSHCSHLLSLRVYQLILHSFSAVSHWQNAGGDCELSHSLHCIYLHSCLGFYPQIFSKGLRKITKMSMSMSWLIFEQDTWLMQMRSSQLKPSRSVSYTIFWRPCLPEKRTVNFLEHSLSLCVCPLLFQLFYHLADFHGIWYCERLRKSEIKLLVLNCFQVAKVYLFVIKMNVIGHFLICSVISCAGHAWFQADAAV